MFLLVIVLPSALNISQPSPSTISEYAPVPPDEDGTSSKAGNLSSLGVASSRGLGSGSGAGDSDISGVARARRIASKACVGNPARQTEDPMAPPCVAFFEGDNGGATYPGVTRDEITILLNFTSAPYSAGAQQSPPPGEYCDLDSAPNSGGTGCYRSGTQTDFFLTRVGRALSRYFNNRYQTYNRHAHFWIFWSQISSSESIRRSEASDNYSRVKPFAVIDDSVGGHSLAYAEAMADKGVLPFSSYTAGQPAAFFRRHAPLIWSFAPDVEHWAEGYVSYVCEKVAPFRVSHTNGMGTDGQPFRGRPRKYALMYSTDPSAPGLTHFADLVRSGLRSCGVIPAIDAPLPATGSNYSTGSVPQYAVTNVARMKGENVTTVLWAGGVETYTGQAADQAKYYPEIVIAGDGYLETTNGGQFQNQNWIQNAWNVSHQIREAGFNDDPIQLACKEGDPSLGPGECTYFASYFRDTYMAFRVIQAAGPRLTPASIDRGMHSTPRTSSNSPYRAACFFDPSDYSCIKDFKEGWWDISGTSPRSTSLGAGCWRLVDQGKRYLPGTWAPGDVVFSNRSDVCDQYEKAQRVG